jgi:hypothetical protein
MRSICWAVGVRGRGFEPAGCGTGPPNAAGMGTSLSGHDRALR